MIKYQEVARDLMVVERAAWWNPRVRRILKAAPLVVMFLLLYSRTALAACSFSPTPDPTVDGAANSLRHAIQGANASGQDCTIQLQAGTYTLTIPNPTTGPHKGQDNTGAYGDLDITDRGHTVTLQGKGAGVSIVNANGIDRAFQVLGGANAAFRNLTIEGGVARDNGSAGIMPGTTVPAGGGVLIGGNGHVSFTQVSIQGNQAVGGTGRNGTEANPNGGAGLAAKGGGLFLYNGTLNLADSSVSGNSAAGGAGGNGNFCESMGHHTCLRKSGPGGAGAAGAGGGLYVLAGSLSLSGSTVSGNRTGGGNGGRGGFTRVVLPSTNFGTGTQPGGSGGTAQGAGIFVGAGTLQIARATISSNSAIAGAGGPGAGPGENGGSSAGAGIFVAHGNINLANSTIFANMASGGFGGTAHSGPDGRGGNALAGGLYLNSSTVSLASDTVASNQALAGGHGIPSTLGTAQGGGIANSGAGLFINTTLIGNNALGFRDCNNCSVNANNGNDVHGSVTSAYSLISKTTGATVIDHDGNHLNVNPLLDPNGLQFNGGPTETVALQSSSPAIDVVPMAHCTDLASPPHPLTTDQRGLPRPDQGESVCDIGAYELRDTIAFSHFSGSLRIDPDAGVFNLSGGFTLGSGGIFNPASNSVTFSVGSYSITAPVGSFVRNSTGYVYQATVNGIFANVSIKFTSTPGKYGLVATARGVIPATASPVPVSLYSGNSSGSTQMTATFD